METWKNFAICYNKYGYIQPTVARMDKYFFFLSSLFSFFSISDSLSSSFLFQPLSLSLPISDPYLFFSNSSLFSVLFSSFSLNLEVFFSWLWVVGCGSSGAVVETWAMGYGLDGAMVETRFVGFWWSWVMQWWQHGDCGLDGLRVLVDLGGHKMGYELVLRWPNRCWYGDWVAGLVVWCFGGGCAWWLVFAGFFFFFFFLYLGGMCVMVGWWWLLACWAHVVVQ